MWKRSVGMGCAALALLAALPARGATAIHFDELGFFDSLNTQYQAQGVVFGPTADRWLVLAPGDPRWPAPSPENVAAVFADSGEIQFTTPASCVRAHFVTGGTVVQVTAFSETGQVLDTRAVASPSYASVLYACTPAGGRIARLLVQGTPGLWGLDNLTSEFGLPPVTAATVVGTAGSNGWYRSAVTVTLSAGDPNGDAIAGIHYAVNGGGEIVTPGAEASLTLATEGEHVIQYYAVDANGMAEAPSSLALRLDWTAPTLEITSPTATSYPQGSSITVAASASDAVSALDGAATHLDLDGTPVSSGQAFSDLAVGSHSVTLAARDVAGNDASRSVTFEVVAPPPAPTAVTVLGGGFALVNGRPAVIHVTARRSARGEVRGSVLYLDLCGGFQVTCQPVLSASRTATGAKVGGKGIVRQGKKTAKRCGVTVEVFDAPRKRRDQFTLHLDGAAPLAGRLLHGGFTVK